MAGADQRRLPRAIKTEVNGYGKVAKDDVLLSGAFGGSRKTVLLFSGRGVFFS